MAWEHFERYGAEQPLTVARLSDGARLEGAILSGVVATGKQRVFMGYRTALRVDFREIASPASPTMHASLVALDELSRAQGYAFDVVGLRPEFAESGLSFNSGWGYYKGQRVRMLMGPPY